MTVKGKIQRKWLFWKKIQAECCFKMAHFKHEIYCCFKNKKIHLHSPKALTWQDSPVHKCKVLLEPGVAEMIDVKMPLDKKHVLKQWSGCVAAISHPFIEGAICDLLQQDYWLLHDGQHLLGPQVSFLKVAWKKRTMEKLITTQQFIANAICTPTVGSFTTRNLQPRGL